MRWIVDKTNSRCTTTAKRLEKEVWVGDGWEYGQTLSLRYKHKGWTNGLYNANIQKMQLSKSSLDE